jgi:hypothetical protein
VPATRLLVVADPKMLPALASGLREGGRFDVLTLPFGDAGAGAAAQRADALAVFYGAADQTVQGALQSLAPAVRGRGRRVVAVLQREQAAERDDCFTAGASDLLFMPMPKEQFVARLADAVGLIYAAERGATAAVQVGARGNLVPLAQATVTPSGVHAAAALPFQPGETVRLSWEDFETWGLVVRASPDAQIRFAGVTPDEDARIREWLRQTMGAGDAKSVVVPAAPAQTRPASTAPAPGRPPGAAAPAARPSSPAAPRPPPAVPRRAAPPAAAGAGSQAGPPPGFADRPRIKETTPVRPAAAAARPAAASAPPARAPQAPQAAPAAQPAPGAAGGLSDLFDDGAPAARAPAPAQDAAFWPEVPAANACLVAGVALVREKKAPPDVPPEVAAAAKKIAGVQSIGERTALEKAGTESHFADAMAARIALEVGRAGAGRLLNSQTPVVVDDESVKAMVQIANAAAARLQKEADGAISRGEVESLQLITASSAALSRDLHSFKEAADRLRGVGSAPRLGAGSLDPEVVLPGQTYRPPPRAAEPAKARAELREFRGLGGESPESRGKRTLVVCMLALVGALINVLFFAYPRIHDVPPIAGVARIEVSGETARITVASDFPERQEAAVAALMQILRERGVQRAMLVQRNGVVAGQLSVTDGKVYGLLNPAKRNDVPLPRVAPQAAPAQGAPSAAPQPAPQPPVQATAPAPPTQTAARPRGR